MARIRVRVGALGQLIGRAKAGDTLVLDEGVHRTDSLSIRNLNFEGRGRVDHVIIEAQVGVTGLAHFRNLTIQAPHFHNALHISGQVTMQDCRVFGDPAGKYPAIFCTGGRLELTSAEVRASGGCGVDLNSGATMQATSSLLGRLTLVASKAFLVDIAAISITVEQRSELTSRGLLHLEPGDGMRSLVLTAESVARIERLKSTVGPLEGFCEESVLYLNEVMVPEGSRYLVTRGAGGTVNSPSPVVVSSVAGEQTPHHEPEVEVDAVGDTVRDVPWPASQGTAFDRWIAPQLRRGDTLVLEAGRYVFDPTEVWQLGVHLRGAGPTSIIEGGVAPLPDFEMTISSLTLRAHPSGNALLVNATTSAHVDQVTIEGGEEVRYPAVVVRDGGALELTDCRVLATDAAADSTVAVEGSGSRLEAVRSDLGWLSVDSRAEVVLTDCTAFAAQTKGRGRLSATGSLTLQPHLTDRFDLTSLEESVIEIARITSAGTVQLYSADSELSVDLIELPAGVEAHATLGDGGRLTVPETVQIHDLTVTAESADSSLAEPAAASSPASEDGTHQSSDGGAGESVPGDDSGPHPSSDPMAEIMALTGLHQVKQQIQGFTQLVKFNQLRAQQGLRTTEVSMHSMFLGNPGTGKTTVARLLGQVLFRAGAISSDTFVEVGRADLVSDHLGGSTKKTLAVLQSARGGVLFIDEAYSLYQENNNEFAQEAVDTLLAFMENNRDQIVVVFAGYADRMQDFLRMNPGLQSRVPNRFDFEDYAPGDIAEMGYRDLIANDYRVDEELYRRTVAQEYRRSADASNGRWVRNYNEDLVKRMVARVMAAPAAEQADLTLISRDDLIAKAGGSSEQRQSVESLLTDLEAMVGLAPVKAWVRSLVNRVALDRQRLELDGTATRPTYHMVFAGNPGTGKTTVARIIAQLFHQLGVLANPTVKVVERSSLVGAYIGHTEKKTAEVIDEAMGGVLFIDEAYQLTENVGANDFGKQAVETLLTRLENDRDKFVAIFAGYTNQMDAFMATNPGLRSRIPLTIEFPDFTDDEVAGIVVSILAKHWQFDHELVHRVAAQTYRESGDRSNGRWARNFAEQIEARHSDFVAEHGITGEQVRVIDASVVTQAAH